MKRREFMALVGGAAACPLGARAQQPPDVPRIAILHSSFPVKTLTETGNNPWRAFFAELRSLGYVEGSNLFIDRYSGEGLSDGRFVELVGDVVRRKPNLIVTSGFPVVQLLKAATGTIPIVALVNDPIATGLAVSLARPGGNVTGVVIDAGLQVWEKRFELLREVVPTVSTAAFLLVREFWESPYARAVRQAAQRIGISLVLAGLDNPVQEAELRRAFAALREERIDAAVVNEGPVYIVHRRLIVQSLQELRLPSIYPYRDFVEVGGLMSYSVDVLSLTRHAAHQVDQILKGAPPGEVPFFQATRFELVINLKTARALGLTVPPAILARADEVLE